MTTSLGQAIGQALASATAIVLLLFNARRLLFLLVAAWSVNGERSAVSGQRSVVSGQRSAPGASSPLTAHRSPLTVLILTSLRNEAASLPGLLDALLALNSPGGGLTIGLIDDGSTDETGHLVDAAAARYAHVVGLHNPTSLGKAAALNAGLQRWPQGQIVVVYDADARPEPSSLGRIVAAFDDPVVAAAGGLIRPANGLASPAATYGAIERLVHQQVTLRAKDRLRLAPAILGSHCAYRRSDLEAVGGFPAGALLEDSFLTMALASRGRLIRFLPDAIASDQVPETLAGYWRQHVRWGRGFHDVARCTGPILAGVAPSPSSLRQRSNRRSPQPAVCSQQPAAVGHPPAGLLRLELRLFSLGYLDRLALLAGIGLLAVQRWQPGAAARRNRRHPPGSASMAALAGLVGLNVLLPYAQISLVLLTERAGLAWWLRLPLAPLFFGVDLGAAVWSALLSLIGQPQVWTATERSPMSGMHES